MNVLDFNIPAGWPGSTETWQFLQNMILNAQNAVLLGGKNFIISGCIESAGNVGNGFICVNGEILPFEGGPTQPNVVVVDDVVSRSFFGGAVNPYYHNRKATFGSGPGAILYDSFKRNDPDNGVLARVDKIEKMLKPLLGYDDPANPGTTVYGSWLFWGRIAAEIPEGWEAVPDDEWKGKVPVVLDEADVDFNLPGKKGGFKSHQISKEELPSMNLTLTLKSVGDVNTDDDGGGYGYGSDKTNRPPINIPLGGSGSPLSLVQPYKVVMFIRFIG